jgi:pimeloyl-ACP methyl ester carboxylesterase
VEGSLNGGFAVELRRWETGQGPAVICLHETGATSESWRPLAQALGNRARLIAFDRRGWGRSAAPEPYIRTTVQEQSEDAARVLAELDAAPAVLCGAGFGAVAALDLLLRRPDWARGALMIEPPLLAFLTGATEVVAQDSEALREAVQGGGPAAAMDIFLSGRLTALGPGADRLPGHLTSGARGRPLSLFAELGAIPAWPLPLGPMAANRRPVRVVISKATPHLPGRAATKLAERLAHAEIHELPGGGPAHLDQAEALAAIAIELAR